MRELRVRMDKALPGSTNQSAEKTGLFDFDEKQFWQATYLQAHYQYHWPMINTMSSAVKKNNSINALLGK